VAVSDWPANRYRHDCLFSRIPSTFNNNLSHTAEISTQHEEDNIWRLAPCSINVTSYCHTQSTRKTRFHHCHQLPSHTEHEENEIENELLSLLSYTHKTPLFPKFLQALQTILVSANRLQTRQTGSLPGSVVLGDAHVQGATAVAQIFGCEHGTLLSDEQSS
jgi:hypothetical protein